MSEKGVEASMYNLFLVLVFLIIMVVLLKYLVNPKISIDPEMLLDRVSRTAKEVGQVIGDIVFGLI